jgi:hypothetical protein
MKNFFAVMFISLLIGTIQAQGQGSPVFMKVNVADAPEAGRGAKQLEISLTNTKTVTATNLVVEYWIINRDVETKQLGIAKEGKETLTLRPTGRETIKSSPAKFTYTPPKSTGGSSHSRRGSSNVRITPESGTKFYGYAVRVSHNDKVVNEQFDPKELKQMLANIQKEQAEMEAKDKEEAKDKKGDKKKK